LPGRGAGFKPFRPGRAGAVFGGFPVPGGRGRSIAGAKMGVFWGKLAVFRGFADLQTAFTGLLGALIRLQTGFPSRETALAGQPIAFTGPPLGGASGGPRLETS
jgi:hypothetical protein